MRHRRKLPAKLLLLPLALAGALAGGCESPALDWSQDEAPKNLRVDVSHADYQVAFTPGRSDLAPAEAAKLQRLVAQGKIQANDRLTLVSGDIGSHTTERRRNRVTAALRAAGVGVTVAASVDPKVGADRIAVRVERAVVTLPNCPNWSKSAVDYTGGVSSNFGCATVTNLGTEIADPADLVDPHATGPMDGGVAAGAVAVYRTPPQTTATQAVAAGASASGIGESQ